MKKRRYQNLGDLAVSLGLKRERGHLSELKAKLTKEIIRVIEEKALSHKEVADLSGVPRTAITGIVSGSLQRVTIDRLIRVLNSIGLSVDFKIRNVA